MTASRNGRVSSAMLYLIRRSSPASGRAGFFVAASDREDVLAKARHLRCLGIEDIEIVDSKGRRFTLQEFEPQALTERQSA